MGFNEDRMVDHLLRGDPSSVESFQVAYLQDEAFRFGQSDQLIGLLKGVGDGLLYQDIDPLEEENLSRWSGAEGVGTAMLTA